MDFYIKDFGAVADGKTLNTEKIQAAIDACFEAGGGRVILSGGTFLSGTVILRQNVRLHIEADSTLLGSPRCEDYPEFPKNHVDVPWLPRKRGGALIFAEECENIGISGMGKIDANGEHFIEPLPEGVIFDMPYRRIDAPTPPRVVFFTGCRNISVTDITMVNQPSGWSYWIHDCDVATFDRVKIFANTEYPNNDGIHINSSRNVTISNSMISCGDDCIIVRANNISLKENKVCEKVTVTNCTLTSHSSGIRIGWINDGIIRNCTFSNLVMTETTMGIALKLPIKVETSTDFGREDTILENLIFSNIIMDRIFCFPITIDTPPNDFTRVGAIRNIYFDNIHARGMELPFLRGRAEAPLENIYFTNCSFHKLKPEEYDEYKEKGYVSHYERDPHSFSVSYVKNFVCNNTSITTE